MKLFCYISKPCTIRALSRAQLIQKHSQNFSTSRQQSSNITISPDEVLSKANRENFVKLFCCVKEIQFFTTKTGKKAAVLVPLVKVDNRLTLLYTERALHLKLNGGEIAFPGGRFEEADGTLERTALREAHEEIGLEPIKVDIWGKGPEISRGDMKVTPVLGYIDKLNLDKLKLNANEVTSVFAVTLENLCCSKYFKVTRFRSGKTSILTTPVFLGGGKKIWGLTAYITHIVMCSLVPDIYKKNILFYPGIQKVIHHNPKLSNSEEIVLIK